MREFAQPKRQAACSGDQIRRKIDRRIVRRLIEDDPLFDAFCITLITITTVGYQEVQSIIEFELYNPYGKRSPREERRRRRAVMRLKDH